MAYPEHGAGYRSNGKSVLRLAGAERADGGSVEERHMASRDMAPTDPAVSADDVKTWGSPDNARAAARARENAKPMSADEERGFLNQVGRAYRGPNSDVAKGLGQSLGFKRGGAPKRKRADGGALPEPQVDDRGRTMAQLAGDDLSEPPLKLKTPSSPEAAQDARNRAAKRVRKTRAMPNSFPVGGGE